MPCEFSDLVVTPDSLEFEIEEGWGFRPPTQDLFIDKVGGPLSPSWDATTEEDWLALSKESGRGEGRIRVVAKSMGMLKGEYNALITISSHVVVTPSIIGVKLIVKGKEPTPPPEPDPPPPEPPPKPPDPVPPKPPPKPPPPPEPDNWLYKLVKWILDLWNR